VWNKPYKEGIPVLKQALKQFAQTGLPDSFFRQLDTEEEKKFRDWVWSEWFGEKDEVDEVWHPSIRDEISKIQKSDALGLYRYLKGTYVSEVGGTLWMHEDMAQIAVVHDSRGYTPMSMVGISDEGPQTALEIAYERMENKYLEDKEYIEELQKEWGDDWMDIMTEAFNGAVFSMSPQIAYRVFEKDGLLDKVDVEE